MAVTESEIDQALAQIRARVRGAAAPPETLTPLQKALAEVNANWYVSARVPPPHPTAPFQWRAVYFAKRVARRAMYEVLNSLIEQQNGLNANVARALTELAQENAALRARLAELEKPAHPSNEPSGL